MAAVRTASPPLLFALDAPDQGFVCLNSFPSAAHWGNADNAPCLAARCDMTHAVLRVTPKCETPNKKSRRLFWHVRFSLLLRSASVQTIGLVRSIALNRVGGF